MSEERFNKIEAKIENLSKRLRHLEQVGSDVPVQADRTTEPLRQPQRPAVTPRPDVRPTPPRSQRPVRSHPETHPATPKRSPKVEMPSMKDTARKFEELLGGRLLAWAGGAAFIVGVGFFLALAISNGWIGETARTVMAFVASAALLGGGVLLHEKKDRTQASLAIASAGIAGLFLSLIAATQLYNLIPLSTSLAVALGIGAVGTAVAVRFSSQTVGGVGLIGAILAPALVGAEPSGTTVAFILIALASTVGVLAWQKWWWLAYAAFIVSAPQIISWVDVSTSGEAVAFVLGVFLVLNILAAIGYELRVPSEKVRASSLTLLTAATALVALAGYIKLDYMSTGPGADIWLVGLAVFHLALGLALVYSGRFNRLLGIWIVGKGVALADVAVGLVGSGPVLSAGWSVSAVFFAYIGYRSSQDRLATQIGAVAQLVLAGGYILISEAPLESVSGGPESLIGAIIGLATFAAALFICSRLLVKERGDWILAYDIMGFATLVYLAAVALDGVAVTVSWVALGGIMVALYSKIGFRSDDEKIFIQMSTASLFVLAAGHILIFDALPDSVAWAPESLTAAIVGLVAFAASAFACARMLSGENKLWLQGLDSIGFVALAYLAAVTLNDLWVVVAWVGLGVAAALLNRYLDRSVAMGIAGLSLAAALLHSLVLEADPVSLVEGLGDVPGALVSLLSVGVGCFVVGYVMRNEEKWWKPALYVGGGATVLYLASTLIVTPFQPGESAVGVDLASLDVRQQGQMLLSIFWAITGLVFLAYGLIRDHGLSRLAGFGLLLVAIFKVFTYDLSTLDSIYRVLSLVVLGLLLLVSAYMYQRMRSHKKEPVNP